MKTKSRSLPSLLTLAAGSAALPVAADAAIIFTDTGSQTIGFGGGQLASYTVDLPGSWDLKISRTSNLISTNAVYGALFNGSVKQAGANFFNKMVVFGNHSAIRASAGQHFVFGIGISQGSFGNIVRSNFAVGSSSMAFPGYNGAFTGPSYLLFRFQNSAMSNQVQYGWVGLTGATATWKDQSAMSLAISGMAYDDTGATIAAGAGAVPEPSTAALAMGGALVLGAAGLRRWRKRKEDLAATSADSID